MRPGETPEFLPSLIVFVGFEYLCEVKIDWETCFTWSFRNWLLGESFISVIFFMSSLMRASNWCICWGVWLNSLSKQSLTFVVSNYCTHWVISKAWCSKFTFLFVFWCIDSYPTDSSEVLNFIAINKVICLSYLWIMSIWRKDISTSSFEALFLERSST